MGMNRLDCEHKVTVIGRLNRQDGEPSFDRPFDSVGRYEPLLPASRATPLREGIAAAYADFLATGGERSRVRLKEDVNTSA